MSELLHFVLLLLMLSAAFFILFYQGTRRAEEIEQVVQKRWGRHEKKKICFLLNRSQTDPQAPNKQHGGSGISWLSPVLDRAASMKGKGGCLQGTSLSRAHNLSLA